MEGGSKTASSSLSAQGDVAGPSAGVRKSTRKVASTTSASSTAPHGQSSGSTAGSSQINPLALASRKKNSRKRAKKAQNRNNPSGPVQSLFPPASHGAHLALLKWKEIPFRNSQAAATVMIILLLLKKMQSRSWRHLLTWRQRRVN